MSNNLLVLAILCSVLTSCSHSGRKDGVDSEKLNQAISNEMRTEENKARDKYRHPKQTLSFFGVQPDMKVVEISPGGGWYTEILGPYLKDEGKLYLAIFSPESEVGYHKRLNKNLKEKINNNKQYFGDIEYTIFQAPDYIGPIAQANSVDRVLTFRNLHNWMKGDSLEKSFKEFHRVLKPGGVLGVVEHRTTEEQETQAESGYMNEDYVIEVAKRAGFELADRSEVNANPEDTADHPKGVWTLPPSLRLKEQDRGKYEKIGESDRMTLKFVKKQ